MQFDKSQTYQNLARAFAGECQAGMRYQMMAKAATQEKLYRLSDCIKSIAKNETVHATTFYNLLTSLGGNAENVNIDAGFPFRGGTLEEMLTFAVADEAAEGERIYPEFAKIAEEEGYQDVSKTFQRIAEIEKNHKIIFDYLAKAVKNKTLYAAEGQELFICSECGYMHTSDKAFEKCPVCGKEQGYVELHLPFDYMGRNANHRSWKKEN